MGVRSHVRGRHRVVPFHRARWDAGIFRQIALLSLRERPEDNSPRAEVMQACAHRGPLSS
jgi:hypothetical protein